MKGKEILKDNTKTQSAKRTVGFHPEEHPDTSLLNESDLNGSQFNYMHIMYDNGVTNQTIANIISDVLNKAGKSSEFLAYTIKNISVKCQANMYEIAKITSDMSITEKRMGRLNK